MRVLVGCEESAVVRDAFRLRGHDAWSCDILPTRGDPRWHYQCDLFKAIDDRQWDMLIAHPECTYLANSGTKHLYEGMRRWNPDGTENPRNKKRWDDMKEGADFFNDILDEDIEKIVVENPIQHAYARELIRMYDQTVQLWEHGHKEMKTTCLWLKGVPKLVPSNVVGPPPEDVIERRKWAIVHREPPGPMRQRNRSATRPGFGLAMAAQWG